MKLSSLVKRVGHAVMWPALLWMVPGGCGALDPGTFAEFAEEFARTALAAWLL